MSDPLDGSTPTANETPPDPDDLQDPVELQSAGDLDEDELGVDPLEEGIEPPENWSEVTENRPTPSEQREGEKLDERLAEERPERGPGAEKPLVETRMFELDDSVDVRAATEVADGGGVERIAVDESVEAKHGVELEGEQVEPTGLAASDMRGTVTEPRSAVAPEEAAERVEDSGR